MVVLSFGPVSIYVPQSRTFGPVGSLWMFTSVAVLAQNVAPLQGPFETTVIPCVAIRGHVNKIFYDYQLLESSCSFRCFSEGIHIDESCRDFVRTAKGSY